MLHILNLRRALCVRRIGLAKRPWFITLALGLILMEGTLMADNDIDQPVDWDAVIVSLVNRNPAPTKQRATDNLDPLVFRADYDWNEDERVKKVFYRLAATRDSELWERAVRHIGDKRFAFAAKDNSPIGRIFSVGAVCAIIVRPQITFATEHRWSGLGGSPDLILGVRINEVREWRLKNAEKSMYELQYELCKTALEKMVATRDVPKTERDRIDRELRVYIKQLTENKQPLFFKIPFDKYEFYSAKSARYAQ